MEGQVETILQDQLADHAEALIATAPRIGVAVIVIALTWLLSKLVRWSITRLGRRVRMRHALTEVLSMLGGLVVWVIGVLISATIVFPTITPGKMLTAAGLGTVAIGLAFKDIFENFFAGILILVREPFRLSDHIRCEDVEGQVERISVRDTHIRRTDGQLVVVPNAMLFKNPVTVRTDRELRRTDIIVGVAYGEDVDEARDVIYRAVKQVDSVRDDVRDIQVFAKSFGSSSVDFEVAWWTGSKPVDIRASRDQVVAATKRALDEAGIEIPFPYRTLTFKDPLRVAGRSGGEVEADKAESEPRATG